LRADGGVQDLAYRLQRLRLSPFNKAFGLEEAIMARRMLALALLATLLFSSLGWAQQQRRQTVNQQSPPNGIPRQFTFKDILYRELRVRFTKEQIFVDEIVRLTEVNSAFSQQFVLAIARNAQQRNIIYPFPYFQAMMIRVAEVKGVILRPM
jgi:hypothetical protein